MNFAVYELMGMKIKVCCNECRSMLEMFKMVNCPCKHRTIYSWIRPMIDHT